MLANSEKRAAIAAADLAALENIAKASADEVAFLAVQNRDLKTKLQAAHTLTEDSQRNLVQAERFNQQSSAEMAILVATRTELREEITKLTDRLMNVQNDARGLEEDATTNLGEVEKGKSRVAELEATHNFDLEERSRLERQVVKKDSTIQKLQAEVSAARAEVAAESSHRNVQIQHLEGELAGALLIAARKGCDGCEGRRQQAMQLRSELETLRKDALDRDGKSFRTYAP